MTTNLLIFFAIPLSVIIISIALQKVLRNPFLVAGIIFSILLVIVLAFFDTIYLIAVVAYTILSFITAVLTCLICRFLRNMICNGSCNDEEDEASYNGGITTQNVLNSGAESTIYTYGTDNQENTVYSTPNVGYCKSNTAYNTNNGFSGMTGTCARKYYGRR